ncbi:zinc finger protein 26-like [Teleopsis dalmanni]|uniref:zinc finger protein 26-like n=1 Tax=Teleopsis dalmanni TaxID=139649 RepID=UPI0018CE1F99|nr:zinc finger protein 26-like [Teleopsis dalmanni]XP_037959570.1 zinc finger protein 26-like [Teleopsis dalmanni]
MADTLSTGGGMEMTLKDSGIVIDMTPAAILQRNSLTHSLRNLRENSPEQQTALDTASTSGTSTSPTNFSTSPPVNTFRCDRCEKFETNSRTALVLHAVHCFPSPPGLNTEDCDTESISVTPVIQANSKSGVGKSTVESQSATPSVISVVANSNTSSNAATSGSATSRKVFECDVCNMKFSNGANMRRHKMRHTGVKPYECRVCQKRFFRKDHLAEHFTTHTKTLPFHCPICNRGFQRQIAMRAHFQNEHVGQHDLVKTCPLCSYRAGSMKSLRIHFFNRHGIDLDNPGPGGASSLLFALENQASQVAAAAAAAGYVPGLNAAAAAAAAAVAGVNVNLQSHQSDSGESMRSMENATPPMHFLTPHVEISTLSDNSGEIYNGGSAAVMLANESLDSKTKNSDTAVDSIVLPPQEHAMDCNAKSLPSSTSNINVRLTASPKIHHDNHITPSISLIPIKQEPFNDDMSSDSNKGDSKMSPSAEQHNPSDTSESEFSLTNNKLNSLIKVSPLKSLLREDLKRRICAKANNRITRNALAVENNNLKQGTSNNNSTCNSTPICNGTITSSGQETELTILNRKQILTCLFCGIEFPNETLYFLHKGCHCESNPWKCNICGEQCNNVYEFNSHLLSKSHQ